MKTKIKTFLKLNLKLKLKLCEELLVLVSNFKLQLKRKLHINWWKRKYNYLFLKLKYHFDDIDMCYWVGTVLGVMCWLLNGARCLHTHFKMLFHVTVGWCRAALSSAQSAEIRNFSQSLFTVALPPSPPASDALGGGTRQVSLHCGQRRRRR